MRINGIIIVEEGIIRAKKKKKTIVKCIFRS
jgi:hypothetical protein